WAGATLLYVLLSEWKGNRAFAVLGIAIFLLVPIGAALVVVGYLQVNDPAKFQAEWDGIVKWWAGLSPLDWLAWAMIAGYILLMPIAGLVLRQGRRAASNIGDHAVRIIKYGGSIFLGEAPYPDGSTLGQTLENAGWEKKTLIELAEQLRIHAEYLGYRT